MAGRHPSLDALLSKEALLTMQYMSICETNVGLEKKIFLVSKPYLIVRWRKNCRLNNWNRAQKTYLQEISLWSNLGLSGKILWEAAVTVPVLDLVHHLETEES